MKTSAAFIAGLGATASAATVRERGSAGLNGPFAGVSSHSGNEDVHLRPINAIDGFFQLDGKPTTSCPFPKSQCPPGTETVFGYSAFQTQVGLSVEVNGGQFVYINPDGALAYTPGHDGGLPAGSVSQGFKYTPPTQKGNVGVLTFEGQTAKGKASGFVVCPAGNLGAPYTVYAAYEGISEECIGIGFTTAPTGSDAPAAYQYDV